LQYCSIGYFTKIGKQHFSNVLCQIYVKLKVITEVKEKKERTKAAAFDEYSCGEGKSSPPHIANTGETTTLK
jgi:hypothetical protein